MQSMFYVPQYAPHYIQMWLSWCLHELTHHSNRITQIWPCDGHVNQAPTMRLYIVVSSTRSPSSALNFTFCSNGIEMGLHPVIPYSDNLFKAYCLYSNHIPLKDWITSMLRKSRKSPKSFISNFCFKSFFKSKMSTPLSPVIIKSST